MGSGASFTLQENMSEEYLRQYDQFDQVKYRALHDQKGEVSKEILLNISCDGIAREVYLTYISYCPTGYMDLEQYITLLRAAKFLNKQCNRQCAELFFHGARFAAHESDMHINFFLLIDDILPRLAKHKEVEMHVLFHKLAFVELGSGKEEERTLKDSKPTSLAASLYMATTAVAAHSDKMAPSAPTSEQELAATLVQKKARARNAKRKVQEMREIKIIRGDKKKVPRYPKTEAPNNLENAVTNPPILHRVHTTGTSSDKLDALGAEIILEEVFSEYCTVPGQMDCAGCKKMFRENKLLSKKFTLVDVDIVFRKGMAKVLASDEDNPLREGVIFEKRVTYPVFRAEIIGQAAHERGIILDQYLELLKSNYIELKRVRCSERDHGLAPGNGV